MNIINLKLKEKTGIFEKICPYIKNKEVINVLFFTMIIFLIQLISGFIKDNGAKITFLEILKNPLMFIIPLYSVIKKNKYFFLISVITMFLVVFITNLLGIPAIFYNHRFEILDKIDKYGIIISVLYFIPLVLIVKNYINKKVLSALFFGIIIAVFILVNFFYISKSAGYKIYSENNYNTYIMIGIVAYYIAALEEGFYRGYLLEKLLQNGYKVINVFIFTAVVQAVGIILSDRFTRVNDDKGMVLFLFLMGSGMFYNYLYVKVGRNLCAGLLIRGTVLFLYFLSY